MLTRRVVPRADELGLLEPERAQVDLAHAARADEQHRAPVVDEADRLGDRLEPADRLDHVRETAEQHLAATAAGHRRARESRPSSSKCA